MKMKRKSKGKKTISRCMPKSVSQKTLYQRLCIDREMHKYHRAQWQFSGEDNLYALGLRMVKHDLFGTIHLVGDFNQRDHRSHSFYPNQDGAWVITLRNGH